MSADLRTTAGQVGQPAAASGLSGPAGHRIAATGEQLRGELDRRAHELELLADDAVSSSRRLADAQRAWDLRDAARRDEIEASGR